MKSGFHIVGWGVATQDKAKGSKTLHVNPKELLPNSHGKVTSNINTLTKDSVDDKGNASSTKTNWSTYLDCTWLDLFGHTPLPPDIRKGERVILWRQSDSQKHFWTGTNIDIAKRRVEEVVIMAVDINPKDRKVYELNYDNTYSIKLDTYDKFIRLRTCKNDGESFVHELLLDAKNEYSTLRDDVGNHVSVDSKNTIITLENKDKTKYELNKKDINIYCAGNYTHNTEGNYSLTIGGNQTVKVGGNYTREVGGSVSINSGGNYSVTNGGDYSQDSPNISVSTSNYSMNSPMSAFSGMVTCAGISIGGGASKMSTVRAATPLNTPTPKIGISPTASGAVCQINGDVTGTGNWNITGSMTLSDSLTVNQISVGTGGIQSAGPITAPNLKYT